jgi:hypothetical protein
MNKKLKLDIKNKKLKTHFKQVGLNGPEPE